MFDTDTLQEYYEQIRDVLVEEVSATDISPLIAERIKRLIDYTLNGGKLNRGVAVLSTLYHVKGGVVSEEELRTAAVLGWCIEWIQGSFLVADDMMDSSVTRRGHPCWYKLEHVGGKAVNDAMLLMTQVHRLIKKHVTDKELYYDVETVITDTIYQTELGQMLDMETQPPKGQPDLSQYTVERYEQIVKYKTAFYSFYAPVSLGLLAGGIHKKETHERAKVICLEMGKYFQIQDDFLDCYGTPEQIGKIGTDIVDGKCSWLMVTALKIASDDQKKTLHENYAKNEEHCVVKVKQVYAELELEKKFREYEEEAFQRINQLIDSQSMEGEMPKEIFSDFLAKIFKRQK